MSDSRHAYAIVDTSAAPIIHVRALEPPTEASFEAHLAELHQAMESLPHFSLVLEQGPLRTFPIRFTRRAARWIASAAEHFGERWISTAYVIDQPPLVAVVRGLFWGLRQPMALTVTPSIDRARSWTWARLREAGVLADETSG